MKKKNKSKVVAVTLYPADLEIVDRVKALYDTSRSAVMRIIIRDWGRLSVLAEAKRVTVRELTDIILSSFASEGGG